MTKTRGGSPDLDSFQFRKIITLHTRIGYNLMLCDSLHAKFLTQSWFDNYAAFCNFMPVGRASDSDDSDDGLDIKLFILVGWGQSFLSVA